VIHGFCHLTVTYRPSLYAVEGALDPATRLARDGARRVWASLTDLGPYAMPVAQQKIAGSARAYLGLV
jgi:hypothetical protein